MRASHSIACAVAAATLAGSAHATFIHFDINAITVSAGDDFSGLNHTGTLVLASSADSDLTAIELDSVSQSMAGSLGMLEGEIELSSGTVAGGWLRFSDQNGAEYFAVIEATAGSINTQAGLGFRIDGLTDSGVFSDLMNGESFAGVDLFPPSKMLAEEILLDGSFLLHGFGPGQDGFDGTVDIDIYADVPVPAPGPSALVLTAAGLAGSRRRR